MIDLCPRCRIQAPHRPGRERCPRCGGPLQVVDSGLIGGPAQSNPAQSNPAQSNPAGSNPAGSNPAGPNPASQNPMPAPARPSGAVRPVPAPTTGPRSARVYRSRHVRWVARRPPEAIPARRFAPPAGPRPIPRYHYLPRWGLWDVPVQAEADNRPRLAVQTDALGYALRLLAMVLGVAAVMHLFRYVLLVINRSTPIPGLLDRVTAFLVIFAGLAALVVFVYATVVFTRWVIEVRADAYRWHDRRDPRPRWRVAVLAATPLVNVVGAALLLHEAARMRDDLDPALTGRRLQRLWVAWVIVNVLALAAIITQIVATASGSIQTGANGLAAVVISSAVSAVFAWWLAGRLRVSFGEAHDEPVPARRWVAVA
ncbi:DUF4328 domain-containing protein [Gordonia sp. CPCC 206044]|uniref:DUF4328 domain-containing protein n=1 Tax=Gordonia sp. CPCC 206044 TaxID=3140793 RepID=UPI003AF33C48